MPGFRLCIGGREGGGVDDCGSPFVVVADGAGEVGEGHDGGVVI